WNEAHPGMYYLVYDAKNNAYFNAPWFYGFGAWYVKEDGSVGLDTPEGLAAAEFFAELRKIMPKEMNYGIAQRLFDEGRAAIVMNGPWAIAEIEAVGINYGMTTLPIISANGKPASPFIGVKILQLTPNAVDRGHAEVALDVMKYYTRASAQVYLAKTNQMIPTAKATVEDPEVQALPSLAGFANQAALASQPMPSTPFMSVLWNVVPPMLDSIWTGGATPAEAVKTAQEEAESGIEEMK
ncbi:MAG TPA: extracellular solute-binding protein, partial [Anaerolineae bacterium]|nr:extracellular solute-binding protein [Anaerolineae bacterium]